MFSFCHCLVYKLCNTNTFQLKRMYWNEYTFTVKDASKEFLIVQLQRKKNYLTHKFTCLFFWLCLFHSDSLLCLSFSLALFFFLHFLFSHLISWLAIDLSVEITLKRTAIFVPCSLMRYTRECHIYRFGLASFFSFQPHCENSTGNSIPFEIKHKKECFSSSIIFHICEQMPEICYRRPNGRKQTKNHIDRMNSGVLHEKYILREIYGKCRVFFCRS